MDFLLIVGCVMMAVSAAWAFYSLYQLERRVDALNKRLEDSVYDTEVAFAGIYGSVDSTKVRVRAIETTLSEIDDVVRLERLKRANRTLTTAIALNDAHRAQIKANTLQIKELKSR